MISSQSSPQNTCSRDILGSISGKSAQEDLAGSTMQAEQDCSNQCVIRFPTSGSPCSSGAVLIDPGEGGVRGQGPNGVEAPRTHGSGCASVLRNVSNNCFLQSLISVLESD